MLQECARAQNGGGLSDRSVGIEIGRAGATNAISDNAITQGMNSSSDFAADTRASNSPPGKSMHDSGSDASDAGRSSQSVEVSSWQSTRT